MLGATEVNVAAHATIDREAHSTRRAQRCNVHMSLDA